MQNFKDDRDEMKPRRCLRCSEMFLSEHAGNRICLSCSLKPPSPEGLRRVSLDIDSITSERTIDDDITWQAE